MSDRNREGEEGKGNPFDDPVLQIITPSKTPEDPDKVERDRRSIEGIIKKGEDFKPGKNPIWGEYGNLKH